MADSLDKRMLDLQYQMKDISKDIAQSMRDTNDRHLDVYNEIKEIKLGINIRMKELFYLLTLTVLALIILAGAEKILTLI